MSTSAGTPPEPDNGRPPAAASRRKDLRDSLWGRALILGVVLVFTMAVSKTCASTENEISQDEAVAIAREHIDFEPDRHQIRYLPQGIPPVYYWAVNFQTLNGNGQVRRAEVVLVNATTGAVPP